MNAPNSLDQLATGKLDALCRDNLARTLVQTDRFSATGARVGSRELISFACNDYLNLSHHPEVVEAAVDATRRYGTGAGASRLVTGNHPLFADLEARLARLKGAQAAIVFGSGYLANVGIVPALVGDGDLILLDEFAHACMWAGARLSRARLLTFPHNAAPALADLLGTHRGHYRHCLVMTEGVFSMDGDLAPLPEMSAAARAYDAWLLTDDAHGLGVTGGGRGSSFAFGEPLDIPLQMGTLSKAVGAYGGYLCASGPVIDLLRNRARSFVYSTGLPPGTVAAAIRSLDIIASDPSLCERPLEHARLFTRALGLDEAQSPIVPVILHEERRALAASDALHEAGFLVTAIRPPSVPEGTSRLRFTFTPAHRPEDIHRLAALVRPLLARAHA